MAMDYMIIVKYTDLYWIELNSSKIHLANLFCSTFKSIVSYLHICHVLTFILSLCSKIVANLSGVLFGRSTNWIICEKCVDYALCHLLCRRLLSGYTYAVYIVIQLGEI